MPGALAGARGPWVPIGLVYIDGHLDLYDGETSPTGEAADMPMSVVLGRGPAAWVEAVGGRVPDPRMRRSSDSATSRRRSATVIPHPRDIAGWGPRSTPRAWARGGWRRAVARSELVDPPDARWVHLDVDVLDEAAFPATDYLMPGGLGERSSPTCSDRS